MNNNQPNSDPDTVKLVVVGDGSVGKTCILVSYTTDQFPTEYVPTVFENYTAQVSVNGKDVNLSLIDTAGQETYDKLRVLSYGMADIFLIVCSVAEKSSFENVIDKWIPELSKGNLANVPKIIVGNKTDMRDSLNPNHIITDAAKQILAQHQQNYYFECSAMTQEGLKIIFDEAIKIVLNKRRMALDQQQPSKPHQKSSCCSLQ